MMPNNLRPIMGPQRTVGRSLAGEVVPPEEVLRDLSPWVMVWVDPDLHDSLCLAPEELLRPPAAKPADVLGFLAQCAICPQQAMLTDQVYGHEWLCPRCAEVAEPAEERAPWAGVDGFHPDVTHVDEPERDRVAVQLADGRIFTGPADDVDPIKRGVKAIESVLKFANALLEDMSPAERRVNGFGDVDVAAAEPLDDEPDLGNIRG